MTMSGKKSTISPFYRDRSILITGATGFMGKVLVEKLLRSCSGIKTIYLLLRPKGGRDAKRRLEDLLKAKLFERVKSERPSAITKLVAIHGDLTCAGLGISSADMELLVKNVSIVFHSAATVKFDEPLKRSVEMNVLGTRRLVELCHKMKKLEALVHVSTAYCNCDRKEIEEVVYQSPVHPQKIIDAIEWMDEDLVSVLTPHLIRGRPNTYTYTKALAETLLVEESCDLPVAIVRPSIVSAAWKEPLPGWVDNYNGPTGLIIAKNKGILRSMLGKSTGTADLIPVDVVINLIISVAWYTATQQPKGTLVYNCSSGSTNKVPWEDVDRYTFRLILRHPSHEVLRLPNTLFTNSNLRNYLSVMMYQYVPAYFLDLLSVVMGRKPKFVLLYKKIHRATKCLEYFTSHEWTFISNNVLMLQEALPPEDRKEFNFDIQNLHWPTYLEGYVLGIRKFLLKEEASSSSSARKKLKRLFLYSKLSRLVLLLVILRIIFKRYSGSHKLCFLLIPIAVKCYSVYRRNILSSKR